MDTVILAATHRRAFNSLNTNVPRPLLDFDGESLLTRLVEKLSALVAIHNIYIVTNEAIKQDLSLWAQKLSKNLKRIHIISDGTMLPEQSIGPVGDLMFTINEADLKDDLLVIGSDNWFTYDIQVFIEKSKKHSPAVIVTKCEPEADKSRFGMAQVDNQDRIIKFVEKPKLASSHLNMRASCIYYFSAQDIQWLNLFAKEQSINCTPGTFISWLVNQTPVYGVEMQPIWHSTKPGPDILEYRNVLKSMISINDSTWERKAVQKLLKVISSSENLMRVLEDDDPNMRIMAMELLKQTKYLSSKDSIKKFITKLINLLGDPAINQYAYEGYQDDEDSIVFVSITAAEALVRFGYAKNVNSVFEKAQKSGFKIEKH